MHKDDNETKGKGLLDSLLLERNIFSRKVLKLLGKVFLITVISIQKNFETSFLRDDVETKGVSAFVEISMAELIDGGKAEYEGCNSWDWTCRTCHGNLFC